VCECEVNTVQYFLLKDALVHDLMIEVVTKGKFRILYMRAIDKISLEMGM